MTTSPVSYPSFPCYDEKQRQLTTEALQKHSGIDSLLLFGPHVKFGGTKVVDASPTTLFTLAQGIKAALPKQSLKSFYDPEDLVKKVDPTGHWFERCGPNGQGDTLKELATCLQETLIKIGMNPPPSIKVETIQFKVADLLAQHTAVDLFCNVMNQMVDPKQGEMKVVIVNYDHAHAISGATKQRFSEGEFGGNFSIVGGYDKEKELVLLLDTDGLIWVPIADLVDAMNIPNHKELRGYVCFTLEGLE